MDTAPIGRGDVLPLVVQGALPAADARRLGLKQAMTPALLLCFLFSLSDTVCVPAPGTSVVALNKGFIRKRLLPGGDAKNNSGTAVYKKRGGHFAVNVTFIQGTALIVAFNARTPERAAAVIEQVKHAGLSATQETTGTRSGVAIYASTGAYAVQSSVVAGLPIFPLARLPHRKRSPAPETDVEGDVDTDSDRDSDAE